VSRKEPALDDQHVRALVHDDARAQALVLAHARRLVGREAHAAADLAAHHLGRDRADRALVAGVARADLGRHADGEVARVAFGDLHLELEHAEVDHGEQAGVGATFAFCATSSWPTWPDTGARTCSASTCRSSSFASRRWRSSCSDLVLDLELERVLVQQHVLLRLRQRELGLGQAVLGAEHGELGQRAVVERLLAALDLARGGDAVDLGLVHDLLRLQQLLARVDAAALQLELEALARRLLLRHAVLQLGAVDLGQHLVLLDLVAGVDLERDGARRWRRRASGSARRRPCPAR
jgi:hypothetical protein